MPAIPYSKTATSSGAWDGPAAEKKVGANQSDLRALHAWVDPQGDPNTKGAYALPHHEIGADGHPAAANTVACSAAIGVLNGGRGGSRIPAADRQAVYSHLAHHLKDAGMTPPELKSLEGGYIPDGFEAPMVERRFTTGTFGTVEVRTSVNADGNTLPTIGGHASVFNRLSKNLGGFVEVVDNRAFNYSASQGYPDAICRYQHDDNYVLGTINGGTLQLGIDDIGLRYDVVPPQTRADVVELVQRGDVKKSSFAFRAVDEDWGLTDQQFPLRTLLSVELVDVAPVVVPAYPDADAGLRSLARRMDAPLEEVRALAAQNELRRFFVRTDTRLSASPFGQNVPGGTQPGDQNQSVLPDSVLPADAKPDDSPGEIICATCEASNGPNAKFCDQCGNATGNDGSVVDTDVRDDNPSDEDQTEGGEPESVTEDKRDDDGDSDTETGDSDDDDDNRDANPSDEDHTEGGEPESVTEDDRDDVDDGDGDETQDVLPADGGRSGEADSEARTTFGPVAKMRMLALRKSPYDSE